MLGKPGQPHAQTQHPHRTSVPIEAGVLENLVVRSNVKGAAQAHLIVSLDDAFGSMVQAAG